MANCMYCEKPLVGNLTLCPECDDARKASAPAVLPNAVPVEQIGDTFTSYAAIPRSAQQAGRWGMLNIALSGSFLLAVFLPIGQKLLYLMTDTRTLERMPAVQQSLVAIFAVFWLPTASLYLALRIVPGTANLRPRPNELIALSIANSMLVLFLVGRLFASAIQGGGAGFSVAGYSIFTILPALGVAFVVLIMILARSSATVPQALLPVSLSERVAIALLGFGPAIYLFAVFVM